MVETMTRPVRVEHIMGTVISIDLRDRAIDAGLAETAFEWLREVDERFSTYQPQSEISRLGRGELTVEEGHTDVGEVLSLCEDLREETAGVFNACRCRRDGRLDPSGVVKGWAVERAAAILERGGARNFCLNAGGDVVIRGEPEPGRAWRIGIRHPHDAGAVAAVVHGNHLAAATSGAYERGDHIVDARTGMPARGLLSLTVCGPSLTVADAYATAGFAMGTAGITWVAARPGYAPFAITDSGRVQYDDAFADLLVSATRASVPLRPQP